MVGVKKIGRTTQEDFLNYIRRIRSYNNCNIVKISLVSSHYLVQIETEIIEVFTKQFEVARGKEYFYGDVNKMAQLIDLHVTKYQYMPIPSPVQISVGQQTIVVETSQHASVSTTQPAIDDAFVKLTIKNKRAPIMSQHKKLTYLCPRCGYFTFRKGDMRKHFESAKTCPDQICKGIVLTPEIKEHVIDNRRYMPPPPSKLRCVDKKGI